MHKLKKAEVKLTFPNLDTMEKWKSLCFSDALFENLKNGPSHGGFMKFYVVATNTLLLHGNLKN